MKQGLIMIILIFVLISSGCITQKETIYVCYNGEKVLDANLCLKITTTSPSTPPTTTTPSRTPAPIIESILVTTTAPPTTTPPIPYDPDRYTGCEDGTVEYPNGTPLARDDCYYNEAIQNKQYQYCFLIHNFDNKDECVYNAARWDKDTKLCNYLLNTDKKDLCYKDVEWEIQNQ